MSFWLIALKEKGIEGLLSGVSRCWGRVVSGHGQRKYGWGMGGLTTLRASDERRVVVVRWRH